MVGPDQPLADFAPGVDWWVAGEQPENDWSLVEFTIYNIIMSVSRK